VKVLFLLTQDLESPSGLGRYYPLARELVRLGHQVTIAALHSDFHSLENHCFEVEGVHVRYVAPMHVHKFGNVKSYYPASKLLFLTTQATWQLSRAVLSIPADIVHIGKPHPMNSLAGLIAKYLQGRQVYLDCDDFETGVGHFSTRWQKLVVEFFEGKMPYWVDFITTHTYFNRDRIMGSGVSPERVFYLSNGVDRTRFIPPAAETLQELRNRLGLNGKKVVLFLGSLSRPGHPVDLLLEAFIQVYQVEPLSRLLLVGGGDDYDHLVTQVQQMGLSEVVLFPGRVSPDQVVLYYYLADVSVDPVRDDNAARGRSPLKLFESWACGVPFVSADVGDRRMLLGSPPAGLLAQPGDPALLAAAIHQVLSDPPFAETLRQRGREQVQEYYWDKITRELESIYQQTLSKKFLHKNHAP
jgi:glycosyltransferase involved in cell wall biosynthesis